MISVMNDDDNNNDIIILSAAYFPIRSNHPERSTWPHLLLALLVLTLCVILVLLFLLLLHINYYKHCEIISCYNINYFIFFLSLTQLEAYSN